MASGPGSQDRSTFLNACLLESDSELERRARRGRRRAILISIILQILVVTALLLVPLLGKGENIAGRVLVPTVPYSRGSHPHRSADQHPTPPHHVCSFCQQPNRIPTGIVTRDQTPAPKAADGDTDDSDVACYTIGDSIRGVPFTESTHTPRPPDEQQSSTKPVPRQRISAGVQAAMLIRRVEPVYPYLAIQTHREGRVELHAIISTDGSIQSLEVISGDALLIQSALAAVREWRYRPTILNGQPVEVDTHITVIYTLSR